jgi:seryl-tRNA synthetase
MCISDEPVSQAHKKYLNELFDAGLLIPSGVDGVYGLSGVFEDIIERFGQYITQMGAHLNPEVMRFPPVMAREQYLCTDHLATFPNLLGSIHSFVGNDADHLALIQKKEVGEDWSSDLHPTEVVMAPAACYALYPTAKGVLPKEGRIVDLTSFVFRHEPSIDPARLQSFRMREYVRLGSPEQALEHRNYWLQRGEEMLNAVGLKVKKVVANDPFFGRGGRVMAVSQREQHLKYELEIPITSAEKPTAVFSANYHMDHFSETFGIKGHDGGVAHSACVGFGMERIALALFKYHGFNPQQWPEDVRKVLRL